MVGMQDGIRPPNRIPRQRTIGPRISEKLERRDHLPQKPSDRRREKIRRTRRLEIWRARHAVSDAAQHGSYSTPSDQLDSDESDGRLPLNHHLANLCLVHPPMTNREADYDAEDSDLQAAFADASIYALAQAPELTIHSIIPDSRQPWILQMSVGRAGEARRCRGSVDLSKFAGFDKDRTFELEIGTVAPNRPYWGVRVWHEEVEQDFVVNITPFRLLYWRSHEAAAVSGFDSYRHWLSFSLHYLGKTVDVDRRLLKGGHEKRVAILSRENAMTQGASVTDELVLLLFSVDSQHISTWTEEGFPARPPKPAIVADAEKAFVHTLAPEYNREKYRNYPLGRDGLFGAGLLRYAYVIGEDIQLRTEVATFRGSTKPDSKSSMILVEKSKLTKIRCKS